MTLKASGNSKKQPKLPKQIKCKFCGHKFSPSEDTYELIDNVPNFTCTKCGEDFSLKK